MTPPVDVQSELSDAIESDDAVAVRSTLESFGLRGHKDLGACLTSASLLGSLDVMRVLLEFDASVFWKNHDDEPRSATRAHMISLMLRGYCTNMALISTVSIRVVVRRWTGLSAKRAQHSVPGSSRLAALETAIMTNGRGRRKPVTVAPDTILLAAMSKVEPCDAHEAPHGDFTNGNHIGGAR